MKLIDKDALVEELEKRKSELQSRIAELGTFESNTLGLFQEVDLYDDTLSFIDTLEVKEVDLTEDINFYIESSLTGTNPIYTKGGVSCIIEKTAKHFFELGMTVNNKTKKGE